MCLTNETAFFPFQLKQNSAVGDGVARNSDIPSILDINVDLQDAPSVTNARN